MPIIWFTISSILDFEDSKENTEESTHQANQGIITSRYIYVYLYELCNHKTVLKYHDLKNKLFWHGLSVSNF